MTSPAKPLTADEIAKLKRIYGRYNDGEDENVLRLIATIEQRDAALAVICHMPVPEQDNMLAANMRKVANEAIATTETVNDPR